MDERQGWAPVLIGLLTFGMGAYIVGAVLGLFPYDEGIFWLRVMSSPRPGRCS